MIMLWLDKQFPNLFNKLRREYYNKGYERAKKDFKIDDESKDDFKGLRTRKVSG